MQKYLPLYIKLSVCTLQKTTGTIKNFQRSQFGLKFQRLELHLSSCTSQASRHAAESRNSSDVCICYKCTVAYHDSRCGLTSWEKPQANLRARLFRLIQHAWIPLETAVVFFAGRITDSPLLLGFALVIPATSLTCTPGELRIGIVRNVLNKRQTSRRSFAFPASCRLGRQENSDRLKNTFHASSPEPRPQLAGSPCSSAPAIHIYCEFSTQVPTTTDSTAASAGSVLYCLVLCCRELQFPPEAVRGIWGWGG